MERNNNGESPLIGFKKKRFFEEGDKNFIDIGGDEKGNFNRPSKFRKGKKKRNSETDFTSAPKTL